MKQRIFKSIAILAIISLLTATCLPFAASAADYSYEKTGLKALYVGNNNTGNGQDKNATVWKDLSGNNNDIKSVLKDTKNYFSDTGYQLDSKKVEFPTALNSVVNGQEFTIEMVLGDITAKGTTYLTFINCANDNLSIFRRNTGDVIEIKSNNVAADRALKSPGGLDYFKNSTVTVTYKVGGNVTLYVDGVKLANKPVTKALGVNTDKAMWFGHDDVAKNYATEFRSIRFYSKELTAAQVKANYDVDKAVLGKPYEGSTTPSNSTPSNSTPESSTSSAAPTPSDSSSAASSSNPTTGDRSVYAYGILGFIALTSMMLVIRNRKAIKDR